LLLDWFNPGTSTCCFAVWLRQIGFSTFYGSIVLKIYRNLQEYRVRKAHHVFVKEEDLMKYLACMLALVMTGLTAWTLGSFADSSLWTSTWPQCPVQAWSMTWQGYETFFLIYGMRLCYKARNSSWLERWQFTVAVCIEAVVTLLANFLK
uniref:G_PROTEIN_RECEP_F3_4 domain-containing protein n=1 Tax=Thelazia callipaeda TaxID=103827 RepID=A0A0N5DAJ6_THECL